MLGTSAEKLEYQTISDFSCASDYLEYMFGGIKGVSYRATINPHYCQTYYRTSGLIKASYHGVDNCYVSMNTFYRDAETKYNEGRDVKHLKRLTALYVDLDCYKLGLTKEQVLLRLEEDYLDIGANNRIPQPTFIIDSGRGIYLIWKLQDEDRNALPRWQAVQQYLTDTLMELGADQACTDGARILRVPYSRNPKSQSIVTIKDFVDVSYTLNEIAREYDIKSVKTAKKKVRKDGRKVYPYNHATERQRKYVRDIAVRLNLSEGDMPDFTNYHETDNWIKLHKDLCPATEDKDYCYKNGNIYSIEEFVSFRQVLKSYCEEIRKVLCSRTGADCKRELALFLYRYFLREMKYTSEEALNLTLDFNAHLSCPFDESYVITVTASADKRIESGLPYRYKKGTIIKLLEITEEELKDLPFLSTAVKSKKERKAEANRRAYEKRLEAENKQNKEAVILERRAVIFAMRESGATAKEIQEQLHISRATYHRDIVALATESVLTAVKAILDKVSNNIKEATEKAVETAEKGVEAVSDSMDCFKEKAVNIVKSAMSHFFSLPIIASTAKLYRTFMSAPTRLLHYFLPVLHDRGSGDVEGDSDTDSS